MLLCFWLTGMDKCRRPEEERGGEEEAASADVTNPVLQETTAWTGEQGSSNWTTWGGG